MEAGKLEISKQCSVAVATTDARDEYPQGPLSWPLELLLSRLWLPQTNACFVPRYVNSRATQRTAIHLRPALHETRGEGL